MRTFIDVKVEELAGNSGATEDVFFDRAAEEFGKRFGSIHIDEADRRALLESEEIPTPVRTRAQMYLVGRCPATYRGNVLKKDKKGVLRATLPCKEMGAAK
jgi:hypothetical protein